MPDPWTTSASASLTSGDGIVTLVEGSAFCISSRSGEIDPAHPQGLFFRDTRFLSEMRLASEREHPGAAGRDRSRSVQRRVRVARSPREGTCRLAPRRLPPPVRGPRDARGPRDRELRRGSRVLLGRVGARRRLRRPVRGQRRPGAEARAARRARGSLAAHVPVQAQLVRPRRPTSTSARSRASSAATSCSKPSYHHAAVGRPAFR